MRRLQHDCKEAGPLVPGVTPRDVRRPYRTRPALLETGGVARAGWARSRRPGARTMARQRWITAVAATAILVLAGCGGTAPSASPSSSPTGSAGPSASGEALTLQLLPDRFVGKSIGGQRVLLLVTVPGDPMDGPVALRAEATGGGGAQVEVSPTELVPGQVGEVTVIPAAITGEAELALTVTGTRGGSEARAERPIPIVEGADTEAATARAHLLRFIPWLAANRPELGITEGTVWQETPGSWVLIVTHYLFLSPEWEVDLAWHVMTPPNDWIRIQLRHRWSETAPSAAFEIRSAAGSAPPSEIAPDATVWR